MIETWKPMFSIVHSSCRPLGWQAAYSQHLRAARGFDDFEYVLCFDEAQRAEFEKTVPEMWLANGKEPGPHRRVAFVNPNECSYVAATNFAAALTSGRIIIAASDDMMPAPNWPRILMDAAIPIFPNMLSCREAMIWVGDGNYRGDIACQQIITRKWYERYGFIFNPKFSSMGADNDLTYRAQRDGVIIDLRDKPEASWTHEHHRNGLRERDEFDARNEAAERYYQGWKQLREDWPEYMKRSPLDELYDMAANQPSDINEHVPTLRALAESIEDCRILELGVRTGVSTRAFLAARPQHLTSVDLTFEHLDVQIEAAAKLEGVSFTKEQHDSRIRAGSILLPRPWHICFFDSLHTAAHLREEIAAYEDSCSDYLAFHDTVSCWERGELGQDGIKAPIEELLATGRWKIYAEYKNNNGLLILERV